LAKIWTKVCGLVFLAHPVCIHPMHMSANTPPVFMPLYSDIVEIS